ncbi:MAG: cation diffusion facilitator family transporter [Candidatus Micrarchaeota archaeon]
MVSRAGIQERFKTFVFLSAFILLLEVAGGLYTNSLALLSDAGHVLIDLVALLIAYFSLAISQRSANKKFTFGYYRVEILAAVTNGLILVFVTFFIFYEAYNRFISPPEIKGPEMLAIAVVGFLANLYVVVRMHGFSNQMNVRAAYLHVLSDTLSSVGVIIAGILITLTGNYLLDPLISAVIGLFILSSAFRLMKEAAYILMEATPDCISIEEVSRDIRSIPRVKEVHSLHMWCISSDVYALSSHIVIDAKTAKAMDSTVSKVNEMLKRKYGITHTVLQSECESCNLRGSKGN